ncbi:lipase family protein [Olivibacter sp. XZL3]|uniref:lipase family protein n=1 Tax=Olivibacter sp. XZL3 TaxID=1735116 RepID=UPI00141701F0|nr:lipase family protein [Olivibacter sp. XZL3]
MKKSLTCLSYYFLIILGLYTCSDNNNDVNSQQNAPTSYLINSEKIAEVTADDIKQRYRVASAIVSTDVSVYKITYRTQFPENNTIQASGLLLIPTNKKEKLTLLSFQHSTILNQDEAPSAYKAVGNMEAYVGGTVSASLAKGYIVVMPDYVGYGASSNIRHPYEHKSSLAQACLDMLKAAKEFAAGNAIKTRKEIRLLGYSEGAYATMALHQRIEEQASDQFTVERSYPGAGSYDMVGTAQWVVSQTRDLPPGATAFYLWSLLTYNELYGINMPLTAMLQPAAAAEVNKAIASGNLMAAQISNKPSEIFSSNFSESIKDSTNAPFMDALRQNNVYDWKPNAPVTLFHGQMDDIVPVLNSQKALATMQSLNAPVRFISLGEVNHAGGANKYMEAIIPMLLQ